MSTLTILLTVIGVFGVSLWVGGIAVATETLHPGLKLSGIVGIIFLGAAIVSTFPWT